MAQILDGLYWNERYDAGRDPRVDMIAAGALANASGRRILMEVGGDWCIWCAILDAYLIENLDVRAAFRESFVIVKLNYSLENRNQAFLSQYPAASGYPAFHVLNPSAELLTEQDTSVLEEGDSYNRQRMLAFARRRRVES